MREIKIGVLWRAGLKRRMSQEIHEDAASVVDEVAETLGDQDNVNVAGRGLFELLEVVFGERLLERNLDGSRRRVVVRNDADGHGS